MKSKISKVIQNAERLLNNVLATIIRVIFTIIWTGLWIPSAVIEAFKVSYYPEFKRKNAIIRVFENVLWCLRYHRANVFYNLYGLDTVENIYRGGYREYIDENSFWKGLNKLNYNRNGGSQTILLRDKFLFYKYMNANGLAVPRVFGLICKGELYNENMEIVGWESLTDIHDYFIKDLDGQCASFVKKVRDFDDLNHIKKVLGAGKYILQYAIKQHHDMSKINAEAINTLRIITIYNRGKPKELSSILRVGTHDSGNVDNWAAGGLAIGIQNNGYLKKYGYYKPGHGIKTDRHPDTGVVFEKIQIPMLEEAICAACKAHLFFYNIGAIGWDIAITEEGPVFVEGNENFEISLMQACNGGLKDEWLQCCEE